MTNSKIVGVVIAGIVFGLLGAAVFNLSNDVKTLGGVYSQVNNTFREGIKVGKADQLTVSSAGVLSTSGDTTVSGGTLTVTTANTATSTAIVGCVQSYATSTATPWKWVTVASTTQIAPGYNGYILAQYGSCPNL